MKKNFKILDEKGNGVKFEEYQKGIVELYNNPVRGFSDENAPENGTQFDFEFAGEIRIYEDKGLANIAIESDCDSGFDALKKIATQVNLAHYKLEAEK